MTEIKTEAKVAVCIAEPAALRGVSSNPDSPISSTSSTMSVPTNPVQKRENADVKLDSNAFQAANAKIPLLAMTIHELETHIAPWPQKSMLRPNGTAKTVFETSVFMVSEPFPNSPQHRRCPSLPPPSTSADDNSDEQDGFKTEPLVVPQQNANSCLKCGAKTTAPLKSILKRSRKYIITTTEMIQKTTEAGDAAEYTYQESVSVVVPKSKSKKAKSPLLKTGPATSCIAMPNGMQAAKTPRIKFAPLPIFYKTYSADDYDRHGIDYIARQLTPTLAMLIKMELNEVKREMVVHEESRGNTQFYPIR